MLKYALQKKPASLIAMIPPLAQGEYSVNVVMKYSGDCVSSHAGV